MHNNQRMVSFDAARVASCFIIFFYHFLMSLVAEGICQIDDVRPLYSSKNLNVVTVAVGLFFMLSGAGLMSSCQKGASARFGSEYFVRRFKALLVPYYVAFAVYVLTFRVFYGYGARAALWGDVPTWRLVYTALGLDGYLSQYGIKTFYAGIGEWFLGAIVIAYLTFPVLFLALRKNRWITLFVMTAFFLACVFFYDAFSFFSKIPSYTNAFIKLYEFFLGMFLVTRPSKEPASAFERGLHGSVLRGKRRIALSVLALPVLLHYWLYPAWLPYNNQIAAVRILIQNLAAFLFVVGLEGLLDGAEVLKKPLERLAGLTYGMFLSHHVIINWTTRFYRANPAIAASSLRLLFLIEFALTVVASLGITFVTGFLVKAVTGAVKSLRRA